MKCLQREVGGGGGGREIARSGGVGWRRMGNVLHYEVCIVSHRCEREQQQKEHNAETSGCAARC